MNTRRTFLRVLSAGIVTLGLVAVPVLADELLGVITSVDVDGKKVTVIEKKTKTEVVVTITDDTEYVTPKKTSKVDLSQLSKNVEKAKEKGNKGVNTKIEHDNAVASKVFVGGLNKGAGKGKNKTKKGDSRETDKKKTGDE